MSEYIERVTLRVPGHLKLQDENPYQFAEHCVANAKRPDAVAWSVVDVRFLRGRAHPIPGRES